MSFVFLLRKDPGRDPGGNLMAESVAEVTEASVVEVNVVDTEESAVARRVGTISKASLSSWFRTL